jgi:hypothetical protein
MFILALHVSFQSQIVHNHSGFQSLLPYLFPCSDFFIDILSGFNPLGKPLSVSVAVLFNKFFGYMFAKRFNDHPTSYSLFRFVRDLCAPVFGSLHNYILSD